MYKAVLMALLTIGLAGAAELPPQAPAVPQAPGLPPQAPPMWDKEPEQESIGTAWPAPKAKEKVHSYETGTIEAKKSGRPLLTWVGQPVPDKLPEGYVIAQTETLMGFPAKSLVLSVWVGDRHLGVILDGSVYDKPDVLKTALDKLKGYCLGGR